MTCSTLTTMYLGPRDSLTGGERTEVGTRPKCGPCPLKPQCTRGAFRFLAIHMNEAARQRARDLWNTPEYEQALAVWKIVMDHVVIQGPACVIEASGPKQYRYVAVVRPLGSLFYRLHPLGVTYHAVNIIDVKASQPRHNRFLLLDDGWIFKSHLV